jgi:hypothetical protein
MFGVRQVFDLPRRAEAKVAWHLLDRRGFLLMLALSGSRFAPSSKEGILRALNNTPLHLQNALVKFT